MPVNVLALGYPANAPYDGQELRYCQGPATFDVFGDQTMRWPGSAVWGLYGAARFD